MHSGLDQPLTSCGREQPLHLSGAIQPHGVLMHCGDDGHISHLSANVAGELGIAVEELFGRPATALLPGSTRLLEGHEMREGDRYALYGERVGRDERPYDAVLVRSRTGWLAELYRASARTAVRTRLQMFPHFYKLRKHGIAALSAAVARTIQRETGFEKVMTYRFHDDWSGEVVAEISANPRLGTYLGRRFPASDIPKTARDRYLRNPSRLIADVRATPVPIVGRDDAALDLTYSELSSVSPIDLEYLRNMQVGASCSFAVVVHGALWGLIACHNETPRSLSLWARSRSAECVKDFAFAVATYETDQRMRFVDRIDATIDSLLDAIGGAPTLAEGLTAQTRAVLELVNAGGAALILNDRCVRFGATPPEREIRNIAELNAVEGLFVTDHLSSIFPAYDAFSDVASGALVVHAPPRSRASAVGPRFAWFRPDEHRTVVWAGNPAKALEVRDGEQASSPRRSFAEWNESMEGRSARWSPQDLIAAQKFRTSILRWAAESP